jgi:hypothetical protein
MNKRTTFLLIGSLIIIGFFVYLISQSTGSSFFANIINGAPQEQTQTVVAPPTTNAPVIGSETTDTPIINKPETAPVVVTEQWFKDQELIVRQLSNRVKTEGNILTRMEDPNARAKFVLEVEQARKNCETQRLEFNSNIKDSGKAELPAELCQ